MPKDSYHQYLEALEKKRAPAMAKAQKLADAGQYDEAEQAVTRVDDSIYGAVALGRFYKQMLMTLVEAGEAKTNAPRVEEVFRRAKRWAWTAYPEPHTGDEAEDYEAGRVADLAELVGILGYEPTPSWPK